MEVGFEYDSEREKKKIEDEDLQRTQKLERSFKRANETISKFQEILNKYKKERKNGTST